MPACRHNPTVPVCCPVAGCGRCGLLGSSLPLSLHSFLLTRHWEEALVLAAQSTSDRGRNLTSADCIAHALRCAAPKGLLNDPVYPFTRQPTSVVGVEGTSCAKGHMIQLVVEKRGILRFRATPLARFLPHRLIAISSAKPRIWVAQRYHSAAPMLVSSGFSL